MKGIYNDGHHDDHHCSIDHVPGYVVTVLPRQDVGSHTSDPSRNGSDGNFTGVHYLYGSSAASITLDSISGSFYSDCHTVRCVLSGTCKRT